MNLTRADLVFAKKLLRLDLTEHWQRLNLKYIKQLEDEYIRWSSSDDTGIKSPEISLLRFMLFQVEEQKDGVSRLKKIYSNFSRVYLKAIDNGEREQHILNFCTDLGANDKAVREDKKAFSRWFGRDAVVERYQSQLFEKQRCLAFYLGRLGSLCKHILPKQDNMPRFWKRFRIEEILRPLLAFDGDERVRVETFKCLSHAVSALLEKQHTSLVSDATVQYIYRSALERRQDIWIQREALTLLTALSTESLLVVLQKRITQPYDGDDIFVRRFAVGIIGEYQHQLPELQGLLYSLVDDPSPAVRQVLPSALLASSKIFIQSILGNLLTQDKVSAVRASVLLVIPKMFGAAKLQRADSFSLMQGLLTQCLQNETDEFVIKTALKVILDCLPELEQHEMQEWQVILLPYCHKLHAQAESLAIRQMAAQVMEWLWIYTDKQAMDLHKTLYASLYSCAEGHRIRLSADVMKYDPLLLGRVMSLLAQNDFSLTLEKGWRGYYLRKGERFAFRWWRFLHEFRNSSTDKRQSHRHTIGRHYHGLLHAPSAIMSELAETRVPGEPLYISEENASRYYLPLVDHALGALDQGWPTKYFRIVSAEGVTELQPPSNVLHRLRAHLKISSRFAELARLRNWQDSDGDPSAYITALCDLGFEVKFTAHGDKQNNENEKTESASHGNLFDTSVSRFFPALAPLNWDSQLEHLEDYFFSVYENTLFHLGVFVALVSAYFFGRHVYLNQMMHRARNRIPLVIGGWGTRGKSGTERLKAALFNAMGYSVVSKTSGCEAMFLHAPAFGPLREMFLFRPYDKATIWEQVDVVKLSNKLGCEVFLWECMGLTPSYVHVLQRDWMRDDISTITNTYPDHEDLQGPAGYDIPQVMTNFIPRNSTLITSEEQMLPILRDNARQLNTKMRSVGWLEAGLITDDILQRFPYEEHPFNIALVLEVADELGIDRDYALKEMADKVVADLGVLKTYPLVNISGRQLEFINGMSANERFGALGNWQRMGMDQHSLNTDANIWITTVVNNRADRVARSQVFASIMAQDISVDRHILIGDNLQGLLGYVRESWDEQALTLFADDQTEPLKRLESIAVKLRIPVNEQQIINRLQAMAKGLNIELTEEQLSSYLSKPELLSTELQQQTDYSEQIELQLKNDLQSWQEYRQLIHKVQQDSEPSVVDSALQQQAWNWFERKLIVVEDYYSRGDDVVKYIVEQTPPGLKNRVMGMQNIKGTGLDFIYRWQAWDTCYLACETLYSKEPAKAEEAVKLLAQFQEFGFLSEEKVLQSIEEVKSRDWTQREEIQAELTLITNNLKQAVEAAKSSLKNSQMNSGWMLKLAEYVEAFLDAGDAVKRRKLANQIYQDMIYKRISHERAAVELQKLNKRQKGGWGGEYLNQFGSNTP